MAIFSLLNAIFFILEGVKNSIQEVYGLVNYGEFRRRFGGILDERSGPKLCELVLHGVTSIRLKGRSLRIRTPLCPALKKFHQSIGMNNLATSG